MYKAFETKEGVDDFLKMLKDHEYEIVKSNYQLMIKRID